VTEDKNYHGARANTEESRKAQQHLGEDLLQILRRLGEIEKQISRLEPSQETTPRRREASSGASPY
jgi:urease accessory protein UreF